MTAPALGNARIEPCSVLQLVDCGRLRPRLLLRLRLLRCSVVVVVDADTVDACWWCGHVAAAAAATEERCTEVRLPDVAAAAAAAAVAVDDRRR